jgi:hypothetical protein
MEAYCSKEKRERVVHGTVLVIKRMDRLSSHHGRGAVSAAISACGRACRAHVRHPNRSPNSELSLLICVLMAPTSWGERRTSVHSCSASRSRPAPSDEAVAR